MKIVTSYLLSQTVGLIINMRLKKVYTITDMYNNNTSHIYLYPDVLKNNYIVFLLDLEKVTGRD